MDKELSLKEMMMEAACLKLALTLLPNLAFMFFLLFTLSVNALLSAIWGESEVVYTITLKRVWTDYVPVLVVIVNVISVIKNIVCSFLKDPKWVKKIIYTNYFEEAVCLLGVIYCVWFLVTVIISLPFRLECLILYLIIGTIGGLLFASFVKSMKWNNKMLKTCNEMLYS